MTFTLLSKDCPINHLYAFSTHILLKNRENPELVDQLDLNLFNTFYETEFKIFLFHLHKNMPSDGLAARDGCYRLNTIMVFLLCCLYENSSIQHFYILGHKSHPCTLFESHTNIDPKKSNLILSK